VTAVEDRMTSLFPVEERYIRTAGESRRREFVTARACARDALSFLGRSPVAIPAGSRGEPRWPEGVVGSITHCRGYRAAAVASSESFSAIGIDAEPHAQLRPGVLSVFATSSEAAWVRGRLRNSPGIAWDRLLFCMKEAAYKAWAPVVVGGLGFRDALILPDPANQRFTTRLRDLDPPRTISTHPTLTGNWLVSDDLIVAAVVQRVHKPHRLLKAFRHKKMP
jgi:4'-phosphopantetheinyl transferase EntD